MAKYLTNEIKFQIEEFTSDKLDKVFMVSTCHKLK